MITPEIFAEAKSKGMGYDDYQITRNVWASFGTHGMTLNKSTGRKHCDKYVGDWKHKSLEQINRELEEQEWKLDN